MKWSLSSWQEYQYNQAPKYPNQLLLKKVVEQLTGMPPLVMPGEIIRLKKAMALAAQGQAFILQGGDCAESFQDCRAEPIANKLKILLQMSLILLHGLRKPIIRVGRIAGQYAKPRSQDTETKNGITLPCYRGDIVNSTQFDIKSRTPNPKLLLQAYNCSAITLNYIRALLDSGFADLHYAGQWDLSFFKPLKAGK